MRHSLTEEVPGGRMTLNIMQSFLDAAASYGVPGSSEFNIRSDYRTDATILTVYWEDKK
jgi:hypothetical protein